MKHTAAVKKTLEAANLSATQALDKDQLERAKIAAERQKMIDAGELAKRPLVGKQLATFILKGAGGKAAGRPRPGSGKGGGRVVGEMSMTDAAIKVLKDARGPLHAKEVYARAARRKLIATNGKTPEQTMAARLAVGAGAGKFKRTAPNTFTLPEAKKPTAAKRKGPKTVPAAA
jgi:hypothetical protein